MTNPWAEVYFNGQRLGQTPLVDVELPSGQIKLTAVNKEAGIEKVLIVTIKPGETTNQRFNLY
jgi:serine/threonine-protein kinase